MTSEISNCKYQSYSQKMASSGGGTTTPKVKKENSANGGASTTGSGRKWTMPSLPHILPKAGELLEAAEGRRGETPRGLNS